MEILDRQNEIEALEIQATARLLSNRADNISIVQWIIVLLLPILKILLPQSIFLNYLMIIWFFGSFILDYYIDKYTEIAAELKKNFDYYVYGWTNNFQKKLIHLSRIYRAKKETFFKTQTTNSGIDKHKGVKNWYTVVEGNMPQEEAIKLAMKENIYFDKRINNMAYFYILIILVVLFCVLLSSKLTFYEVCFGLFVTFASFTKKLYTTFVNMKKLNIINSNIENLLHSQEVDLNYLQSEIDRKRSISSTPKNLIYFFKTTKIHNEVTILK